MIELRTLGRVSVYRDGDEIAGITGQKRNLGLLVYVAVEGAVTRDRLADLFWGEREEEKAKHSLSQALYSLRRELGERCLHVEGDTVAVGAADCSVDVERFQSAVAGGDWEDAVQLYEGHFLESFSLYDLPEFQRWSSALRLRLARLARKAFRNAIHSRERAGQHESARTLAWRWVALDPLEDEAQHILITLLAGSNDRAAALAQYETYRSALADELGAEPLEETRQLVEAIRSGLTPELAPLASERPQESAAGPNAEADPSSAPAASSSRTVSEDAKASLIERLKQRRLVKVGLVYLGAAWVAIEVCATLIERTVLPPWVFQVLLFFLAVGLPIALIFAWAEEGAGVAATSPPSPWRRRVRRLHIAVALAALFLVIVPGYALINWKFSGVDEPLVVGNPYPITRIAVLYFDDHSVDGQLSELALGLTEEVNHRLTQVSGLDVVSRSAVKPFRDSEIPLDSIARALRVGTVVEGSVSGSPDSLRVTVQLIDTSTQSHLESATVDGSLRGAIDLISEIGSEVTRLLRRRLGVEVRSRQERSATQSSDAWVTVQKARELTDQARDLHRAGDAAGMERLLQQADSLLAHAEELDPAWATSRTARGDIALLRARAYADEPQRFDTTWLRRGLEHAERALALDSSHADALEVQGILLDDLALEAGEPALADSLRDRAERSLRAAVRQDSSRAAAWSRLSAIYRSQARFHEAKLAAEQALRADAFLNHDDVILHRLCVVSLELKRFNDVNRWCGQGQRVFPEDNAFPAVEMTALVAPGNASADVSRAWALRDTLVALSPPQERESLKQLTLLQVAAVLARAGHTDSARAVMRRAESIGEVLDPQFHYWKAYAWLRLGRPDSTIHSLTVFLARAPYYQAYLSGDWLWEELEGDARFQALLQSPPD